MTTKRPDRRGLALVPALVCLLLVTLLCAALLKQAHAQRGLIRAEERRAQAEWLAESGLARASARLAADRGYRGETWAVAAEALGGTEPGAVTVTVEPVKDRPASRRVRVEADYPSGGDGPRARQSKHLTIHLEPETSGGPS